jgi:hypothetical protein
MEDYDDPETAARWFADQRDEVLVKLFVQDKR